MPMTFPTHWPEGFDTEHFDFDATAAVVDRVDRGSMSMHAHTTGQIAVCIRGHVSIQLQTGIIAIPVSCAAWVPPGVMHRGKIAQNAESIFLMIHMNRGHFRNLPNEPTRLMLNQMTFEMIRYFASVRPGTIGRRHYESLAYVILQQIKLARPLPPTFAPIPNNPLLRELAELYGPKGLQVTNAQFCEAANMTEARLRRIVYEETGLTLKQWRVHLTLLAALPRIMNHEPIESVAHSLGYLTSSAFISAFRRVFDMTPGQMRLLEPEIPVNNYIEFKEEAGDDFLSDAANANVMPDNRGKQASSG